MSQENLHNPETLRFDPQTGRPIYPSKEINPLQLIDTLFAWFALLAGYTFCRAFPISRHPLGGLIYFLLLYIITYAVLIFKKNKFQWMPIIISLLALLVCPALIITANTFFHFLIVCLEIVAWCYLIYGAQGNLLEKGFSDLLIIDFIKSIIVVPFCSFGKLFSALSIKSEKKKSGAIGKILLGFLLALLPTIIVFSLLSYDNNFLNLFHKVFAIRWKDFFLHLLSFILGLPIAMYLFGAYYSSKNQASGATITAEGCKEASKKLKKIPRLTALFSVAPILALYGIFFASQWEYYISAFSGKLPETLTYAEYARSGFFQLCTVSVINLLIIIFLASFTKRKAEAPLLLTRVLSVLFSIATLILMTTAFSKLYLYIEQYGLTPLRVYAAWFMILLAVLFLLIIFKQLFYRLKAIPIAALICITLFGLLTLSGIDTQIAEYNADRYIEGSIETLDIAAYEELGDAAIPAMVRIALHMDQQNGTDISKLTYEDIYQSNEQSDYIRLCESLYDAKHQINIRFFTYSIPRAKAQKALSDAGIERFDAPVNE